MHCCVRFGVYLVIILAAAEIFLHYYFDWIPSRTDLSQKEIWLPDYRDKMADMPTAKDKTKTKMLLAKHHPILDVDTGKLDTPMQGYMINGENEYYFIYLN